MLREVSSLFSVLLRHEAARAKRLRPMARFLAWQMRKRLIAKPATWSVFDKQAKLFCYPERTSSNAVVYFDWPDWHEMHLIRRLLRPGDGFLDVGANVGVYSVLAWTLIRPSGRILAFEPDPDTARVWEENAQLNNMTDYQILTQAVGHEAGEIRFTSGLDAINQESETGDRVVERVALDDIITEPEQYTVAKVDVEGAEPGVLRGAKRLLKAGFPRVWMLEINCPEELQSILNDAGFHLYLAEESGLVLRRLTNLPPGQALPNLFAIRDLDWVQQRIPTIQIID